MERIYIVCYLKYCRYTDYSHEQVILRDPFEDIRFLVPDLHGVNTGHKSSK